MANIREIIGTNGKNFQVRYRLNGKEKAETFKPKYSTKQAEKDAHRAVKQFPKELNQNKI